MAKLKFNLNDIHLYDWGELYWFDNNVDISLSAIHLLINNQEKSLKEHYLKLKKKREKELPNVPIEYRDSYEQHFFEHADMTIERLAFFQRGLILGSIFIQIESDMKELINLISEEFKICFNDVKDNMIQQYWKFLVNDFKIETDGVEKYFTPIVNEKIVRNAISHQGSYLTNEQLESFHPKNGIKLKGYEIRITDLEYLFNFLKRVGRFFDVLLIAVDKRYTELKKGA
ncbi:hypothetical protein [Pontimicrobium sp. IMCC45349]|uniref:hypothetical protein n=1 Tax=Pontimicrobium sp. IMCC45349 TaxID=3391574 RepID=UPI0039A288E9